jgi:hypothetical protein
MLPPQQQGGGSIALKGFMLCLPRLLPPTNWMLTVCCHFASAFRQEARTLEELQMQQLERTRVKRYFGYMQQQAAAAAATATAARDQLLGDLQQHLDAAPDPQAYARDQQQQIEQCQQLSAECLIMQQWSDRFGVQKEDAAKRFAAVCT